MVFFLSAQTCKKTKDDELNGNSSATMFVPSIRPSANISALSDGMISVSKNHILKTDLSNNPIRPVAEEGV